MAAPGASRPFLDGSALGVQARMVSWLVRLALRPAPGALR